MFVSKVMIPAKYFHNTEFLANLLGANEKEFRQRPGLKKQVAALLGIKESKNMDAMWTEEKEEAGQEIEATFVL
jgi:hypothetical protein